MNVNELVIETLTPVTEIVVPLKYTGEENPSKYITFNEASQSVELFADDKPQNELATIQIHLFSKGNTREDERKIRKFLFDAGFSYPSIMNETYETETEYYHVTFECEIEGTPDI